MNEEKIIFTPEIIEHYTNVIFGNRINVSKFIDIVRHKYNIDRIELSSDLKLLVDIYLNRDKNNIESENILDNFIKKCYELLNFSDITLEKDTWVVKYNKKLMALGRHEKTMWKRKSDASSALSNHLTTYCYIPLNFATVKDYKTYLIDNKIIEITSYTNNNDTSRKISK